MYSGAQPNQQTLPALDRAFEEGYTNFYLVGSDYVFPRTANLILRKHIEDRGGTVSGEDYVPLGDTNFSSVINKVRSARPEIIFNTLNGDSNVAFFKQYRATGLTPETLPIISFSIAEQEAQAMGVELVAGNYAAWNYFQSLGNPANTAFIGAYKAEYSDNAVITDPMIHGYIDVYLWKAAAEKAGSFETDAVRQAAYGLSKTRRWGPSPPKTIRACRKPFTSGRSTPTVSSTSCGTRVARSHPNPTIPLPFPVKPVRSPATSVNPSPSAFSGDTRV